MLATGPNENRIFLPAAGARYGTSFINAGKYGYYWSSTLGVAYGTGTTSSYIPVPPNGTIYVYCFYGFSVRLVSDYALEDKIS